MPGSTDAGASDGATDAGAEADADGATDGATDGAATLGAAALGDEAVDAHAATSTRLGRIRLKVRILLVIASLPPDAHTGSEYPSGGVFLTRLDVGNCPPQAIKTTM